ncbi:unnamed protein product [Rhodiola kirilowii]
MGELNAPDFETQPWCIHEGPELEYITINASVAHSLPKFSGAHGESATTHLQRLHGICQNLKPNRVSIDDFKLKAFYFSLIDAANDWFLSLPSGSIRTWAQMQKKFLNKYYPATRAMQVRRQLQDIKQGPNEPSGGSMMNLSLSGIRDLIANVAENARFREETTRQDEFSRTKNVAQAETSVNSMPEEMRQIKEMMIQILRRHPVPVKPCEFCGSTNHKADACPTVLVEDPAEINALGGYQGYNNNEKNEPSRQYGQATNPSWRNNSYPQKETQPAVPQLAQSFYQPPPPTGSITRTLHQQANISKEDRISTKPARTISRNQASRSMTR